MHDSDEEATLTSAANGAERAGGYRTPLHRVDAVSESLALLRGASGVVLTTHMNADGDGAGCEAALASWLRAHGTEAWIVNPTPFPDTFRFLVEWPDWILDAASPAASAACNQADLAVVVDTGEKNRIGRVKPLVDSLPKLVIDHHPPGQRAIEGASFRDPRACATGELVFDVLTAHERTLSVPVATGLYVAIMTDTGSFRFSNTTPDSHLVAAELIGAGVDPERCYREVYGNVPAYRLELLRASLENLEVDDTGAVAWMTVPRERYETLAATSEDLEGFVDYPRSLEGVEVGILFRTTEDGATKVSLRSTGGVDVNAVARQFGGGGHVRASGALVGAPLERVRPRVVEAVRQAVRELRAGDDGSAGEGARKDREVGNRGASEA